MAQTENAANERKGRSFSHNKKQSISIDMTPMVDLGFLLITFFVFTTSLSTPTMTDLYMPKDPANDTDSTKLTDDLALTLLLDDDNKIYYYNGIFDKAAGKNEIFETNYSTYSGIGKIIRQKQKDLDESGKFEDGKRGMMLLIKPTSQSVYKNIIDALDEVVINDVKKYAIMEPNAAEINFLKMRSGH